MLSNAADEEVVISVRKVGSADASVGEEGVSTKKFLKKCHVEHKRIGRVPGHRKQFKFESGQREGAVLRGEDVVYGKLLDLESEAPCSQEFFELELATERFRGVDGNLILVKEGGIFDMIKMLMSEQQTGRFNTFLFAEVKHSLGGIYGHCSILGFNEIAVCLTETAAVSADLHGGSLKSGGSVFKVHG